MAVYSRLRKSGFEQNMQSYSAFVGPGVPRTKLCGVTQKMTT